MEYRGYTAEPTWYSFGSYYETLIYNAHNRPVKCLQTRQYPEMIKEIDSMIIDHKRLPKRVDITDDIYVRPMINSDLYFFKTEWDKPYFKNNLEVNEDTPEEYMRNPRSKQFMIIKTTSDRLGVLFEEPIGFYFFNNLDTDFPTPTCLINSKGQGQGLIPKIKQILYPALGLKEMFTEILIENIPAAKMVEKLGWKKIRDEGYQTVWRWSNDKDVS